MATHVGDEPRSSEVDSALAQHLVRVGVIGIGAGVEVRGSVRGMARVRARLEFALGVRLG